MFISLQWDGLRNTNFCAGRIESYASTVQKHERDSDTVLVSEHLL